MKGRETTMVKGYGRKEKSRVNFTARESAFIMAICRRHIINTYIYMLIRICVTVLYEYMYMILYLIIIK